MTRSKIKAEKKTESEKKMFSKWEAARRQRFNTYMEKLRLAIPECDKKTKIDIVQCALDYIEKCNAYKESILGGNEFVELKEEIKRLKRQVFELKRTNSLLVKLVQETGLKVDSRNDGREILCTVPGTCVQNNCANIGVKKLSTGSEGQVIIEDNFDFASEENFDISPHSPGVAEPRPESKDVCVNSVDKNFSRDSREAVDVHMSSHNSATVMSEPSEILPPSVTLAASHGISTSICNNERSSEENSRVLIKQDLLPTVIKPDIHDIKKSSTLIYNPPVSGQDLHDLKKSSTLIYNPPVSGQSFKSVASVISSDHVDDDITIPLINCEGESVTIISDGIKSKQVRILPKTESVLPRNCSEVQSDVDPLSSLDEQISVLEQDCSSVLESSGHESSTESILVEDSAKDGMVTVTIIEADNDGDQTARVESTLKSREVSDGRKSRADVIGKVNNQGEKILLSSPGTCLVMQDGQHFALQDLSNQPTRSGQSIPVQPSSFCTTNTQQRLSVQMHDGVGGGEKESNKGQKVVVLQCNYPTPGTIQLVPPFVDNSQLTYVTPSLSSVPIMSTGAPAPILQGGRIVRMMNTCPVLLLPPNPVVPPLPQPPQPTRLKPIAPKPCSCKNSSASQSKDTTPGSCSIAVAESHTKGGLFLPSKKDSKSHSRTKRPLTLDICDKPAKCSKNEYETESLSKISPPIQTLPPLESASKPVHLSQVEIENPPTPSLQEISTSTLTGLVHSAGIMDCVEDSLGNIMDIRVDMPCVIQETIRESGMESSNPSDDRLVEMLRSIDESDPRSCDFSPPTSPITGTEEIAKPVSTSESLIHSHVGKSADGKGTSESDRIESEPVKEPCKPIPSPISLEPRSASVTLCLSKVTSQGPIETSLNSSSYSINALCSSSKPQEAVEPPLSAVSSNSTDISAISVSNSNNTYIPQLPDTLSEITSSVTASLSASTNLMRVSTPLVLPSSMYPSTSTPLPSRENLPKASSAPTACPLSLPSTASLPPPCIFLRAPMLPSTSHSLPLPLPPLPPIPHLPPLTTDHHSSAHLSSPSLGLVDHLSNFPLTTSSSSSLPVTSSSSLSTLPSDTLISPAITLPNFCSTSSSMTLSSTYQGTNQSPIFSFSLTLPSSVNSSSSSSSSSLAVTSHASTTATTVTPTFKSLAHSEISSTSGSIFSASFLHPLSSVPPLISSHSAASLQSSSVSHKLVETLPSTTVPSLPLLSIASTAVSEPSLESRISNHSSISHFPHWSPHVLKEQQARSHTDKLAASDSKQMPNDISSVQSTVTAAVVTPTTSSDSKLLPSVEKRAISSREQNSKKVENKVPTDADLSGTPLFSLSNISSEVFISKHSTVTESSFKEGHRKDPSSKELFPKVSTPSAISTQHKDTQKFPKPKDTTKKQVSIDDCDKRITSGTVSHPISSVSTWSSPSVSTGLSVATPLSSTIFSSSVLASSSSTSSPSISTGLSVSTPLSTSLFSSTILSSSSSTSSPSISTGLSVSTPLSSSLYSSSMLSSASSISTGLSVSTPLSSTVLSSSSSTVLSSTSARAVVSSSSVTRAIESNKNAPEVENTNIETPTKDKSAEKSSSIYPSLLSFSLKSQDKPSQENSNSTSVSSNGYSGTRGNVATTDFFMPTLKTSESSVPPKVWSEQSSKQGISYSPKGDYLCKPISGEGKLFYPPPPKINQPNQISCEKPGIPKAVQIISSETTGTSNLPAEVQSGSNFRDSSDSLANSQGSSSQSICTSSDFATNVAHNVGSKFEKQSKLHNPTPLSDESQSQTLASSQESSKAETPRTSQMAVSVSETVTPLQLTRSHPLVKKSDQNIQVSDESSANPLGKVDQTVTSPQREREKLSMHLQQNQHSSSQHNHPQQMQQQQQLHHQQHQVPKESNSGVQRSPASAPNISSQTTPQPPHQQQQLQQQPQQHQQQQSIGKYQSSQKPAQQHPASNSTHQQSQHQQLSSHHRTQQHNVSALNNLSHMNPNALQKHPQSQTQQLAQQQQQQHQQQQHQQQQQQQQQQQRQQQQQNPIVQQQVAGHTIPTHNSNLISGSVIGEVGEIITDKRSSGHIAGTVMQPTHQPGMVPMPYHPPPMVSASSYMQPPMYDYNAYCRKGPHSPRSEGRHQCYGYGKQQQYQHGELLTPDSTMMSDPRLPHNPPMPMPMSGFIEAAEDPTPMRAEPSSEHVRYFSVSHLVSHSNDSRKASSNGQQKESSTSQSDDKTKDSPRSKSGSRKSESKSRSTGSTKNSSQGDSHSRRRSPARGSQQGSGGGTASSVMWGNKSSPAHKQSHNYSAEALLSSQNYGRSVHRPPANNNYSLMAPNQMYQSNYSPQQVKNFVPNSSFGYTSHDRNSQGGCNPDYNFQLHTQPSGSLAYSGNMAYMPTGYPYQNLPPSSSSMLSGEIMPPPHPAGPYPRFHEFPADQSNFPPNPTFPLPLDPQDVCSGGGLMGAASGSMSVRAPHSDMQLAPASSTTATSVSYSRSNSNRNNGNINISSSVPSSINSNNQGTGSSSVSSKRPRYGEANMVSGGVGSSANLLEGGALAHISLHSFTPPCDDPTLVHSNLFPSTAPRHQGNFLLGHDNLMPINAAQYPSGSSGTGAGGSTQLGTGSVTAASGSRSGSSVVLPPGAPPGHVPFSPLRVMDRQQVNMAPPTAPHLSSSLSNFNLTSIIPEIDGKTGENNGGMGSSSRGGGIVNNEVLGSAIPSQPRLPPMPSSLLPSADHLKGLPADANRLPPPVLNNSMNNIFPHPPHHQVGLGLNSSLPLPPTSFSGINFPTPDH